MPELHDLLERRASRYEPPRDLFDRVVVRRRRRDRNRRIGTAVVALALAAAGIGGLAQTFSSDTIPASDPRSPFVGTWVSTDVDGSAPRMTIGASDEGALDIVVHDDAASVCSGVPSTMRGSGRLEGTSELVVPSPVLTCDDGSQLEELSPPVEEQLRNLTFVHDPEADVLTDSLGVVWDRDAGEDPSRELGASGGMWPQSSLEEVRDAQELADAGDPRYTWQIDPRLAAQKAPYGAEIFARFLQEELGWQEFRAAPIGHAGEEGFYYEVTFVRCAPGRTNPLYPDDPEGQGCAPTIDEFRYETVNIDVGQLGLKGPSGIWVVTRWAMPPPSAEPITPNTDMYGRQLEQVVPPTDAEVADLLEAFLQARIDGEGAEEYLHSPEDEMPLLYATSSGASYERFEIERVEGPVWPIGHLTFKLRLFAEGGATVVEQDFTMYREGNGRLGLEYFGDGTTENGEAATEPASILDGEVTLDVSRPWSDHVESYLDPRIFWLIGPGDSSIEVLAEPMSEATCSSSASAPASAEELVRAIRSNPHLETTAPAPARVGGVDAVRLDVAAVQGAPTCRFADRVPVVSVSGREAVWGSIDPGYRGRLYILDIPGGSARALAILIMAPEADFERAVRDAAPVMDSFEFHTG